jgi:hypothetical protein
MSQNHHSQMTGIFLYWQLPLAIKDNKYTLINRIPSLSINMEI